MYTIKGELKLIQAVYFLDKLLDNYVDKSVAAGEIEYVVIDKNDMTLGVLDKIVDGIDDYLNQHADESTIDITTLLCDICYEFKLKESHLTKNNKFEYSY